MRRPLLWLLLVVVLAGGAAAAWWFTRDMRGASAKPRVSEEAANRMRDKLGRIQQNSGAGHRPATHTLNEEEVNSYFQYHMGARIPQGVSEVRFTFERDRATGACMVDFDQVKAASRRPINPLLDQLLSGRRAISATGRFTSSNGTGLFHLEQVTVGNMSLSGWLLELVLKHFVQPRYPRAAIDRPFQLPAGIQQIVVEDRRVVIRQ